MTPYALTNPRELMQVTTSIYNIVSMHSLMPVLHNHVFVFCTLFLVRSLFAFLGGFKVVLVKDPDTPFVPIEQADSEVNHDDDVVMMMMMMMMIIPFCFLPFQVDQDALDEAGEAMTAEQALAKLGELGDMAALGRNKVRHDLTIGMLLTNDHQECPFPQILLMPDIQLITSLSDDLTTHVSITTYDSQFLQAAGMEDFIADELADADYEDEMLQFKDEAAALDFSDPDNVDWAMDKLSGTEAWRA